MAADGIKQKRLSRLVALAAGWALLAVASPVLGQDVAATGKASFDRTARKAENSGEPSFAEVLKRLNELEAQVGQYKAETVRLQSELAKRDKSVPRATAAPSSGGVSMAQSAAQAAPAAKAAAADDWAEPEVVKKTEGRDEEARRRLTAVETQVRKVVAEVAKEEEEKSKKPKYEFSGKYKVKSNTRSNFNLDNPRQSWAFDDTTFFDHRFQLGIEASHEALSAKFLLDKGNFVFDWKEDGEGTQERWGQFDSANAAMVRELYVQYSDNFLLRIGRQNWEVGNSIVHDGPEDGIKLQYPLGQLPWGQTTVTGAYWALAGGWKSYSTFRQSGPPAGDRQAVLSASNKLDAYYLDLNVRAGKEWQFRPYVLRVSDRGKFGDADLNLDKDFDSATTRRDGHFQPLWTGLAATANFKKWKFDAEVVWLTGSYAKNQNINANAMLLKSTYSLGETNGLGKMSVGVDFGRGSGNEANDPASGTIRDFNGLFLCRDRFKFGNIFSEDIRAGYYFWDSSLANVTFLRAHTTIEPFKDLKVTPAISKMWTTEAVYKGRGPVGDWSRGLATSAQTTNDVGWEVDLNLSYPFLKNLDGFLNVGYFTPGAVYSRPNGGDAGSAFELVIGSEFKF